MKLVGDCRDTSSLSVRRPCRKVVNWVYYTSISFVATRFCCWQRKKKLRHLPPYTTPISATSTTLGELVSIIPHLTLETGKLDTTFRTRRRGFQDFLSEELDIKRPGGICSPAQLVVRDALHFAMSETWELGTSQINYRTLPGNLPHRSWACLNKIFLGRHIYIYIYTTTQIHTEVPNTIKMEEKSPRIGQSNPISSTDSRGEKKTSQFTFFSLSSCL